MPAKEFSLDPQPTERIGTPYRRIQTALPVPESLPMLERLRAHEARSMRGQAPLIWADAEGFQVRDGYGNQWLDWSSGVLVGNAGHNHPRIKQALRDYLDSPAPIMAYCFAHEARAQLVERLADLAPDPIDRVFLLTTGSEATEVALKLARTHGIRKDPKKRYIVSFASGFHGRTYGAQLAGGVLGGAEWVDPNPYYVQVPFPGSSDVPRTDFDLFVETLKAGNVPAAEVAGVIAETFQGREAKLMPVDYAHALRDWCTAHDAALIFDEVQAGFGRTGKLFAFEHYDVIPDMVCCGKGISSSLPLSATIGRATFLDLYGPGEMTSTHTGSPLPCVASLANLDALIEEGMIENAATQGAYLIAALTDMIAPFRDRVNVNGTGLVTAMLFVDDTDDAAPDPETAFAFCERCFLRGNLFFAPVGKGYGAVKFCPPLNITREAIDDGLFGPAGIKDTLTEILSSRTVAV